ncbi:hypothetical protein [Streptomyces sp. NPDC001492]
MNRLETEQETLRPRSPGARTLGSRCERLPAGLSRKLPAGEHCPEPAVTSALPATPVYFSDGRDGVLLDAAVTAFGDDPQTSTGEWAAMAGFLWGTTVLLAWPVVRILRRTRRT